MNKILVVVDMQNDFIDGSLGTKEARAIVPNVKKKIAEAVQNGDHIVYTRDTHFEDYLNSREGMRLPVKHCIFETPGWEIHKDVLPPENYDRWYVFNKYTFGYDNLPSVVRTTRELSASDEIELVGLCTDICVVSNALLLKAAFYDSMEISVDATCCAGVTPETHEAALKTMEMCQINVKRD
jgi:nicotinamidase-related amidase